MAKKTFIARLNSIFTIEFKHYLQSSVLPDRQLFGSRIYLHTEDHFFGISITRSLFTCQYK